MYRDGLDLVYEFSVYQGGAGLPWFCPNTRPASDTGWLSDHNPPLSVCAAGDRMFIGTITSEAGHALMAVSLDGKKLWGSTPLGSAGSAALAFDGEVVYSAGEGQWAGANSLFFQIDPKTFETRKILTVKERLGIRGLAAKGGKLYVSSDNRSKILVIDVAMKAIVSEIRLNNPGGIAFAPDGKLLAISGTTIVAVAENGNHKTLAADHLTGPRRMAVAKDGTIFVSDGPASWYRANDDEHNALYGTEDVRFLGDNQVKVFDATGKFIRAIGTPRTIGKHDQQAMRCPMGVAIDANDRLWVCEWDMLPKRISVWSRDGKLIREFIGAHKYGGGGTLDPGDKSQMVYDGMVFKLDWENGTWKLDSTIVDIMNALNDDKHIVGGYANWPTRIIRYKGEEYFVGGTGSFNSFNGGTIWKRKGDSFVAVSSVTPFQPGSPADLNAGKVNTNHYLYPRMVECVGEEPPARGITDRGGPPDKWNGFLFFLMAWSDQNGDGIIQPKEANFIDKPHYWLQQAYIGPDLSVWIRNCSHRGTTSLWRLPVARFNENGAPIYDFAKLETIFENRKINWGSIAVDDSGNVFLNSVPIFGYNTKTRTSWTYPSQWGPFGSGAPRQKPGLVVSSFGARGYVSLGKEIGTIFAVNSNYGQWYLFTADGLFVATIFGDCRTEPYWGAIEEAKRGMLVTGYSHGQESFEGSLNKAPDGNIYIVAGHPHCSIIKLNGLDTIKRLQGGAVEVKE